MKNKIKKNWNDISLRQFNEIKEILEINDEFAMLNILGIVYPEIDFEGMTLPEFAEYKDSLNFISEQIPKNKLKKQYILNDTKYDSNIDITAITISQFIDYQNFIKRQPMNYSEVLSVFFRPEGHNYNDGYDMNKVKEDIQYMKMPDILALIFFLTVQSRGLLTIIPYYLKEELKKMKKTMTEADQTLLQTVIDQLGEISQRDSELSHC